MNMKKFAFLAMLLGSSFLYGCGEAPKKVEPKKEDPKTEAPKGDEAPKTETPKADEAAK
jgi:hypothetical protein